MIKTIPPPPCGTAILPESIRTLLRILLSSNSAVLINIITGVSPQNFIITLLCIMFCVNVKEFPHDMT
jgi:hypothetical protein